MLREPVSVRVFLRWLTLLVLMIGIAPVVHAEQIFSGPLIAPPPPSLTTLELSVGLGVVDRGTTGIGAPLLGHGYDQAGGAGLELDARVLRRGWSRYVRHGVALRLFHQSGRMLGITNDGTFQLTGLDLAYALRTILPCISSESLEFHLTPLLGLSALLARAGSPRIAGDQTGELREAARANFDHEALGAVLGLQFDAHHGPLILAVTGDLREHFAFGNTPVARTFMTSLTVRVGIDLDL